VDHRPEVAIALTQPLWIVATTPYPDGAGEVTGHVLAIGWDRPQRTTFYLVSDPGLPRPVWIPEDDIVSNSASPPG
jgi:hypothetical protein